MSAICPKCKTELHSLIRTVKTVTTENLTVQDGHRVLQHIRQIRYEDIDCPHCGWRIADNSDEALQFLLSG